MKHDQKTSRDTFAIINVLADLAAEAQLIARVAADMDDPAAVAAIQELETNAR